MRAPVSNASLSALAADWLLRIESAADSRAISASDRYRWRRFSGLRSTALLQGLVSRYSHRIASEIIFERVATQRFARIGEPALVTLVWRFSISTGRKSATFRLPSSGRIHLCSCPPVMAGLGFPVFLSTSTPSP